MGRTQTDRQAGDWRGERSNLASSSRKARPLSYRKRPTEQVKFGLFNDGIERVAYLRPSQEKKKERESDLALLKTMF